jgi:hypothetical protein
MTDTTTLIDDYVAMWNEPDATTRRQRVHDLWAPNGRQVLAPPQPILDLARPLGFPSPTLDVGGREDLEFRVTRAYEEFVAGGQYFFRTRANRGRLDDVVLISWEMVDTATSEPVGGGIDVLMLDDDDRITVDYQFIDA